MGNCLKKIRKNIYQPTTKSYPIQRNPSLQPDIPKNNKITVIEDVENPNEYCIGGYHRVQIGELYDSKYFIVEKLGWGFSSTVWRCFDLENTQKVALKVVKSGQSDITAAFHEIKMLKEVESSNDPRSDKFIKLLDYFKITRVNGIHLCLVLELMEYDLVTLVNMVGKKLPLAIVKNIIKQILEALDHLHTNCKLIHTDIKTNNILISGYKNCIDNNSLSELSVKIGDLGSACRIQDPNSKGFQTFEYRSHEFLYEASIGPSADVWSVACIAFELVIGECLFDAKEGKGYSREEDQLALTIAMLGEIPKHVALSGKYSRKYFTYDGKLRHVSKRKPESLFHLLLRKFKGSVQDARKFADFLLPMLEFDPNKRASAGMCVKYPWL